MNTKITLIDINPQVVAAWRQAFANNPEVQIKQGSMLREQVDAWVSPTNARAEMDGGLDFAIKQELGDDIEARVQYEVLRQHQGRLNVGHAVFVETGRSLPRFLISTPTMERCSQDISTTHNVAFACAAAFQAIHLCHRIYPGRIRSAALPGLGANTGRVPPVLCAKLMWSAYELFRRHRFRHFEEMREILEKQLRRHDLASLTQPLVYTVPPEVASPLPSIPPLVQGPPTTSSKDIAFCD